VLRVYTLIDQEGFLSVAESCTLSLAERDSSRPVRVYTLTSREGTLSAPEVPAPTEGLLSTPESPAPTPCNLPWGFLRIDSQKPLRFFVFLFFLGRIDFHLRGWTVCGPSAGGLSDFPQIWESFN
jgi:hypothetical protein